MAIQLARAIGMQRKPISPLEGLSDIIAKTGQDITSSIEKKQAQEQAKEERKQALKDAMSANIKFDPIEATPQDQAEYENYARKGISELAVFRADPNVTPAQFQAKKDEFEYGLGERKIKYKTDFDTLAEAKKRKSEGTHYTENFDNYLTGTPDREETEYVGQTENEYGEPLPVVLDKKTKTIKGEAGYFQLPFEERKKIDLRNQLEEKSVVADVDALKASQGYFGGDYTPRIHVGVTTTSKGATEFNVDEKGLELDAQKYASSFIGNTNYTKEHNIKKRNYETAAIRALKESDLPLTPESIANYTAKMAYEDFKTASDVAIKDEIRKQREARALAERKSRSGSEKQKKYIVATPVLVGLKIPNEEKKGQIDKIDYNYHSIQTSAVGQNPIRRNIGGYTNAIVQGVYVNPNTNKIEYIKISPEVQKKDGDVVQGQEDVVVKVDPSKTTISDIANEVGKDYFYKSLGIDELKRTANAAPAKKETSASPSKQTATKTNETKKEDLRKKYNY